MISLIKNLFYVSRPISWPNTAYPFAAGYIVSGGSIDLLFVVATLYFLGPYNLLMYGINDIFDYESDIRNPRKGGIEGMKEQRSLHPAIIKAVVATNIPFLIVMFALGGLISSAILVGVLFFVVAYSVAKLRFKEVPILDSITSSLHFVGPLLFALSLNGFPVQAWPYVTAFFLWGVASHAFGAVQDIVPDRKAGLSSVATFFGGKATVRLATILYFTAATIIIFQPMPFAIIGIVGLAYAFNISHYIYISDKDSPKANTAWRRFIWLNLFVGFVVTMLLIISRI